MANKSFIFRFDDVEVREREFTLLKAGKVLTVEPKAFRVLLSLLHNPQKLITKEELLDAVWGDTAVTEGSLTRCIWLLRSVLGDDTHQPRYIETVATMGYRFVCPVEAQEDAHSGLAHAELADPRAELRTEINGDSVQAISARAQGWAGRIFRRRWLLATMVAVGGLLASAIWYLRRPLPPLRVTEYNQITHDDRRKDPIGTDGARIYLYLYREPQHWAQVAVSGGEVTPFPFPLSNAFLRDVSPDGSNLLVTSFDSGRGSLWCVQVPGGSLRRLLDDDSLTSAVWSPDGRLVAYSTLNGDINVIRSDGAESHKLVSAPDHSGNHLTAWISWSPDGSRIRFTRDYKFWEIFSNGSGLHPLLPDWHASELQCCGRWTPDGRFFVFLLLATPEHSVTTFAPDQIWALDERHSFLRPRRREPVQLTSGPIRWGRPIPNKDGKRVFATGVLPRGELERFDAQSRQLQPYLSGISAEFPSFSPDGKFVAYVTFPEGILWRANRDGSNPIQLTDPPMYPMMPRWSPDGTQIIFRAVDSEGRRKIYLLPSRGGKPEMLLPSDNRAQDTPNWSPDGRKIVFWMTETTANDSKRIIRTLDPSTGQITDIPGSRGYYSPHWSPDGRYITAITADTESLGVFDFKTQQWSALQKGKCSYPLWSRDGKYIYFLRPVDDPGVYRIRPSGGKAERVVDLEKFRSTGNSGYWFGLDPEDTPLLLRDTGTDDIFSLTLEER